MTAYLVRQSLPFQMVDKMLADHGHLGASCLHLAYELAHIATDRTKMPQNDIVWFDHYPTLPSSEIEISFCASTANSIGSCCSTSLTNPVTTRPTASSCVRPRWMQ